MSPTFDHPPADACLMLRAHAEQRWLSDEVGSVLRQLQRPGELAGGQLGAALAYLEVAWREARRLAAETDAACAELELAPAGAAQTLASRARGYHAAVHALRETLAGDVDLLLAGPRRDPRAEPGVRIVCAVHARRASIRSAVPFDPLRRDAAAE